MPRGVARLDDSTKGDCSLHGPNINGKIITASPSITADNRGVARLNDQVKADCGCNAYIITASPSSFANSRGIARLNDQVGKSTYVGKIITASPNETVD